MKLRTYRSEAGITLADLAKKAGVTEVAMSRYERGDRTPRPEIMRKIEEVTGGKVRPNDFVSGQAAEEAAPDEQDAAESEETHPRRAGGGLR